MFLLRTMRFTHHSLKHMPNELNQLKWGSNSLAAEERIMLAHAQVDVEYERQ